MVNLFLILILVIIVGEYLLDTVIETLNVRHLSTDLPEEFAGYYDAGKYKQSQEYLRETTRFGIITDSVTTPLTIIFILVGGFNLVDTVARSLTQNTILTGLIFAVILMFLSQMFSIPFSIYSTFVIEEKYGFNRTTIKTFVFDILKGWALTLVLGGIVFSIILWFFDKAGSLAWVYCWVTVVTFQIVVTFIAPIIILPLFNKFSPLEDGELKTAIYEYAQSQHFKLKGIFKMDASKRSTKSNAFFTGFGKYRRIVLFDTLIEKHTVDELLSILAHEMGHYKNKHILKSILLSAATTGIMFYILSLFLNNESLFKAFQMDNISIYASLFFFGFLYTPISMIISVGGKLLSRKHEFEADAYASRTYKKPEAMISALKKLTVDNLSNLTPHPLKVFLSYSHPPVLDRIRALKKST